MNEQDEFHGQGGSYVLDPKTGKRRRVEEPTRPAESAPASPPAKGETESGPPAEPAAPEEKPRPAGPRRSNPAAAASGD